VSDSMGAYRPPLADEPVAMGSGEYESSPSSGPHVEGIAALGVEVPRDWEIDNGWMTENRPWPFESAAENPRLSPAAVLSSVMAGLVLAIFIIAVIR
jgi:hypothetical protein